MILLTEAQRRKLVVMAFLFGASRGHERLRVKFKFV
jgi:hypothetical protein